MIQLNNVLFGYSKRNMLIDNLSESFEAGRIYGLLGKNGTGKTTLIKLMTGLLMPHEGECLIDGEKVQKRQPQMLEQVFVVPEEFQLPAIKPRAYVNINAPFYPNFSVSDFETYMNDFEMDSEKRLNNMSFGQRKKFLLSFALATNVKYLFLDEPTNGLDIPSKSQLRKTVARAISDERSIIISTHQARDLESLIDTILIMEQGKIIFNQDYNSVTDKLHFDKVHSADDAENVIYAEETLGGTKIVSKHNGEADSILDLELLFNAVVTKQNEISTLF